MTLRPFQQVDVFATAPFSGNPLAVVLDGRDLGDDEMTRFARWTNLSETTFLLPPTSPDADYRVRIFTLAGELPFAGHPTLGSCHAWLTAGGVPRRAGLILQECGVGLVPIRSTAGRLAFAAPPLRRGGPVDEATVERVATVLGIGREDVVDAAWIDNGPGWVGLLLADAETVLALQPQAGGAADGGSLEIGVVGAHAPGSRWAFEVRAFFTDAEGHLREDPVTGSLNASVAQWLLGSGRAASPYVARQGTRLRRAGEVLIEQDGDGTVWVGGAAVTRIRGEIEL